MIELEYQKIKEEVESFCDEFQSDLSIKSKIDKYYKGVQVMFSPIKVNPKIMFIGINPGAGFSNFYNRNVKRFSPLEKSEYSYGTYRLATQTKELFKLAKLKKIYLDNTVKSNCFFFAARNEKELYKFLSHLKKFDVYKKSQQWTDKIVNLINPKIIICEGKSAFIHFLKNKSCENISNENDDVLYANWNGIHIIGYKRRFSFIIDIQKVADKLNKHYFQ